MKPKTLIRVGIGGPVGSGKTTLAHVLCETFRDQCNMAVVTNDIYTREDAMALEKSGALPSDRIVGVETGGCPHTAIRDDISMNLEAIRELQKKHKGLDLVLVESGGDNLTATFSPELADIFIYVIDVTEGEDIPRKGGPAIAFSDLLIINKIELAPYVDVDLESMSSDTSRIRKDRPWIFTDFRTGHGIEELNRWFHEQVLFTDIESYGDE
ncbi:MAG TPA: urease accessory protein UreG [Verrucomicrobia bacterium]|nr:urease accessory protein UreG [Verrucomicrobiales bacterium]HIL55088.1 urease accessory protein UreG [Verrucomicrobiota bacterium]